VTLDEKQYEEAKRYRNWDPALRWQAILDAITWAESQSSARLQTPALRKAEERRKLAFLAKYKTRVETGR
jgi:hypothetical protein